jgi:hypothetical protein
MPNAETRRKLYFAHDVLPGTSTDSPAWSCYRSSVLQAMDEFWMEIFDVDAKAQAKWAARGQNIEQTVRKAVVQNGSPHDDDWDPVARACGEIPFRCLEIGAYCGYSALRIARNRECCAPARQHTPYQ